MARSTNHKIMVLLPDNAGRQWTYITCMYLYVQGFGFIK